MERARIRRAASSASGGWALTRITPPRCQKHATAQRVRRARRNERAGRGARDVSGMTHLPTSEPRCYRTKIADDQPANDLRAISNASNRYARLAQLPLQTATAMSSQTRSPRNERTGRGARDVSGPTHLPRRSAQPRLIVDFSTRQTVCERFQTRATVTRAWHS